LVVKGQSYYGYVKIIIYIIEMDRFLSQTRKLFKKSSKRLFTRLVNINAENVENFKAAERFCASIV